MKFFSCVDPLDLRREIEKVIRSNGESAAARLDRMMSNALNVLTSEVNKALFPAGLQKPFPANCLSLMTTTGAKGGLVCFSFYGVIVLSDRKFLPVIFLVHLVNIVFLLTIFT